MNNKKKAYVYQFKDKLVVTDVRNNIAQCGFDNLDGLLSPLDFENCKFTKEDAELILSHIKSDNPITPEKFIENPLIMLKHGNVITDMIFYSIPESRYQDDGTYCRCNCIASTVNGLENYSLLQFSGNVKSIDDPVTVYGIAKIPFGEIINEPKCKYTLHLLLTLTIPRGAILIDPVYQPDIFSYRLLRTNAIKVEKIDIIEYDEEYAGIGIFDTNSVANSDKLKNITYAKPIMHPLLHGEDVIYRLNEISTVQNITLDYIHNYGDGITVFLTKSEALDFANEYAYKVMKSRYSMFGSTSSDRICTRGDISYILERLSDPEKIKEDRLAERERIENKAKKKAAKILKDLEALRKIYTELYNSEPYDGSYFDKIKANSENAGICESYMKEIIKRL